MHLSPAVRIAALSLGLTTIVACSGTATTDGGTPAGATVAVAVEPATAKLGPSESVVFAATVTGTINTSVRWSVREAGGGAVDASGRYVAPAGPGVFHVDAVSVADATASAAATVTVTAPPPPVVVTVTPGTGALDACRTLTLTASVTGTANTAVTWSVLEGPAGGAVTPAGVYTAPANAGVYHLVATSQADGTKSGTATVTVTERVLSVQVTPATVSLPTSGTTQLSATVTTSCGSFAAAATLDPTGRIVAN